MLEEENLKPKILRGTLCKVMIKGNENVEYGDIVEFAYYNNGYTFKLSDGSRLTFMDENDFQTLPSEEGLKTLLDLALSTRDKEWFEEILFKMETESVSE